MVIPFFLRSSVSSSAYSSLLGLFSGSMSVALSIFSSPHCLAREWISSGLPIRMRSAISSASTLSAALNVRSSVASGSTMRCLLLLARSMICCTKLIVVFCMVVLSIDFACKFTKKSERKTTISNFSSSIFNLYSFIFHLSSLIFHLSSFIFNLSSISLPSH